MRLLEDTSQRVIRYLDSLGERNVAPTPEAVSKLARLEIDLPEDSTNPRDVIAELDSVVSPATMASAGRACSRIRLYGS